ncbi:bifunctional succinylornithine transaminase/acetylornithine transaminase [Vibrio porteresiae]|uniref:Acetylornithine aminotransferase n=1 Tax=Vibrio porteresiae DSM 19223 TaxID=1123496 RepID=A0ABZ0Q8Q5_9VIBR|nr:bifunctional succinylornithine transaminase/acetylornithine transaminase [Vibrio porteresiae]WPC72381.1 bifunctional succinylornithine transaminase/acetylornithine transaminase [Vibrio porteresiae DSM 19223]
MKQSIPSRNDFDQYMIPMYSPAPFIPVKAQGSTLYDQNGKEYIDFVGGIAVNALGHANPALREALIEQSDKLWHTGNGYTNEPVLNLAKHLVESTFADKVFFCNSGAEANEAALKLARRYARQHFSAEKTEIIAFNNAFHGRTLFTVSTGGQPNYSKDFAPLPGAITHLPFNDLAAVEAAISDNTCAVIVEPIQGEGGVVPATAEFLRGLRALCDKHNAVLIFDEVQTGVGRTGYLYAYQSYGVTPDMLSTAKALGGGFPIGGILTTDKFASALSVGSHGTTYGGNPLACAVANASLNIIDSQEFLANVRAKQATFVETLENINRRLGMFVEIRSAGLLIGCQLTEEYAGQAKAISTLCAEHGVMTLIAGPNVIRFTPALNISQQELETGLARFEQALKDYQSRK